MKSYTTQTTGILNRWMRFLGAMLMVALMVPAVAVSQASPAAVNLGTAGDFVILAKTGVSTTGTTGITGDIGISPAAASYITGFGLSADASNTFSTSPYVTGKIYAANYAPPTPAKMTTAVSDMEAAYTNAAGRAIPDYTELYAGDITGKTLTRGLYKWGTGVLVSAGGVTISGSASDVWIFQIAQNLTIANGAIVTLSGGAQASNIFWQVAGQVTLGTTAAMKGVILCQTQIAMNTGATMDGRALAQSAVTMDANSVITKPPTGTAGPATTIALTLGNNQSGATSSVLANSFRVTVTDASGNLVQGRSVTFAISSVPTGATGQSLSTTTTTTNASGQAATTLTLGNIAGTYTVTATSTGLSGSPVTFTTTATGSATTIALTSGNNQIGTLSAALANTFRVTVTDAGGNLVQGTSVTFAISSIPTGATGHSLSTTTTTTNASGQAATTLTLGNMVGTYTVTATSTGLSGSPVTFTATGSATTIALTSGNNQSGAISSVPANSFGVTVIDAGGNLVQGTSVTFAISSTPTGATGQSLSTTTATTNASGQATSTLTLGNIAGTYTVTATSTGLSGSPVTFTATATGAATTIALTLGNNQSGSISSVLTNPFVVSVTGAGGNLVQGTSVTFAIASTPTGATGQSLSTTTTTTNASGQASTILTFGNRAGTYTITASSGSLTGSPVTFTATANNLNPTVISSSPNSAGRGSRINVVITGTNFLAGVTTATFGADITVNSQSVTSATQIAANITISSTATTGGRDVSVTNASPGGGTVTLSNGFTINTSTPTSVENGVAPQEFSLSQNYPNPFNPSTKIEYSLEKASQVSLKVYNLLGDEVATLVNSRQEAGSYTVPFNTNKGTLNLSSGVYFYRLEAGSFVSMKKLILMK